MIFPKLAGICLIGFSCLIVGCQEYTSRHEGVSRFAGNANAINEAKMVADPWNRNAYDDHIPGNGERLGEAVRKYQTVNTEEPSGDLMEDISDAVLPVDPPAK